MRVEVRGNDAELASYLRIEESGPAYEGPDAGGVRRVDAPLGDRCLRGSDAPGPSRSIASACILRRLKRRETKRKERPLGTAALGEN